MQVEISIDDLLKMTTQAVALGSVIAAPVWRLATRIGGLTNAVANAVAEMKRTADTERNERINDVRLIHRRIDDALLLEKRSEAEPNDVEGADVGGERGVRHRIGSDQRLKRVLERPPE
jgi:hypothetical protein